MRDFWNFLLFSGIIFLLFFLFFLHLEEKKDRPTRHCGEAYADISRASPPPYLFVSPTSASSELVKTAPAVKVHKNKPPVIPGSRKTVRRGLLKGGKKLRLFKSEKHLKEYFKDSLAVDSSLWRRNLGWPSKSQIKWLVEATWGEYIRGVCEYLKIPEYANLILSIAVHESSGSPHAVNRQSGATGLGQPVYSTADLYAALEECNIPQEYLDRSDPEQNILIYAVLFKHNLNICRRRKYSNAKDWAILYHYTGPKAAADTAAYYAEKDFQKADSTATFERSAADVYATPFWKSISHIMRMKPVEAPDWAKELWRSRDWENVEKIRLLVGGRVCRSKERRS